MAADRISAAAAGWISGRGRRKGGGAEMIQKEKVTRADLLELIDEYCDRIRSEKNLLCVLEMARCCWKEEKRAEKRAEAAEAGEAFTDAEDLIKTDGGKIIYLFPSRGGDDQRGRV